MAIRITPSEFATRTKKARQNYKAIMKAASRNAAEKSRRLMKSKTPVDLGQAKEAWQVRNEGDFYSLVNDCPYIEVLDTGARPHGVNEEGQALIMAWIYRHFGNITEKEANSILWGIMMKLKTQGQEGHHFMSATSEQRQLYFRLAVEAAIKDIF